MSSQIVELELYKNGKDWYKLCTQFGQFHGNVFICQNCSCQYANVKRTVINHLLKHCLRGDQQKYLVTQLIKIGDTSKYVTDWVEKLKYPNNRPIKPYSEMMIPKFPLQRLDSKLDLNSPTEEMKLSKIDTNLSQIPQQEETPTTDMNSLTQHTTPTMIDSCEEEHFDELENIKKLKSKTMGPRNQPPAWKIVSNQYGVFTPMNQTEKKTSRRRFWYTCTACQSRMTENKTGITNHLLKSCLSIDTETKKTVLDMLLACGEDAPYILKMKHINNDKVHNAGRSARRGSRQSSAGILRGSQNRLHKTPFHDQAQRLVNTSLFKADASRYPTQLHKSDSFDLDHFPRFQSVPKSLSCESSFKDDSSFLALSSFAEMLATKIDEQSQVEPDLQVVKAELLERKLMIDAQFKNLEKLSKVSLLMRQVK